MPDQQKTWSEMTTPEKDRWVAINVFGWKLFPYMTVEEMRTGSGAICPPDKIHISTTDSYPKYTTDANAALEVLKMVRTWDDLKQRRFCEHLQEIRCEHIRLWVHQRNLTEHRLIATEQFLHRTRQELFAEVEDYAHAAYLTLTEASHA